MAAMNHETDGSVLFTYNGQRQEEIPLNVTHLSIDTSIPKIGLFFGDEIPEGDQLFREPRGNHFVELIIRRVYQEVGIDLNWPLRAEINRLGFRWGDGGPSFGGCTFGLNHNLKIAEFHEGLSVIGVMSFVLCTSLMKVSIPATVENIDFAAFLWCESLVQVDFQQGLKTISPYAFCSCKSLSKISFPDSLREIGGHAFENCTSLREVNFQEGLNEVGIYAFEMCSSLTSISIPPTVRTIDTGAFCDCKLLVDVGICDGLKVLGAGAFSGCKSFAGIYIPSTLVVFGGDFGGLLNGCESLLGVEIAAGAAFYLPQQCLLRCDALVNISIPSAMEYSDRAFEACPSLLLDTLGKNDEEVALILKDRYANLPVHECCYRSTTTSTCDLLMQMKDTSVEARKMKDVYQMTPFHVLVTTSKLRPDLLDILLHEYPLDSLAMQDIHERTMMDYLLMNRASPAVSMIKLVLERAIIREMPRFGLSRWSSELSSLIESMDWNGDVETRRMCVDKVTKRLAFSVGTEMASLLELALWKKKMTQTSSGIKRRKADAESCLMTSGAELVIPNVLDYLWEKGEPTGFLDTSILPSDVSWLIQNLD